MVGTFSFSRASLTGLVERGTGATGWDSLESAIAIGLKVRGEVSLGERDGANWIDRDGLTFNRQREEGVAKGLGEGRRGLGGDSMETIGCNVRALLGRAKGGRKN